MNPHDRRPHERARTRVCAPPSVGVASSLNQRTALKQVRGDFSDPPPKKSERREVIWSGRKMASEELVEMLLGRAFKALQIWPHFSCPITAASIPPARTPSSNQGSLHAIPGTADSFFLGAFAHAAPHPLPGLVSLLSIPNQPRL